MYLTCRMQAREFFLKDPALSWAAYIGGALIVLMKECHVRPQHGIAMLVSSEVPEGKGVSSSAAVEVAAMTALSRAHGVELDGRRLALLCQMVENLVVGEIRFFWLNEEKPSALSFTCAL
jgi:galactokinase